MGSSGNGELGGKEKQIVIITICFTSLNTN